MEVERDIRFSVVIPSFNQGRFLADALDSILGQDGVEVEVIVMDAGSQDETVDILEAYSDKLAYWVSEPDKGQADAIRRGFSFATGNVFAWLNCDDMYLPNALSTVAAEFRRSPDLSMVYGDYILLRPDGEQVYKPKVSFDYRSALYAYMPIAQPASFMARTAYERVGGVEPSFHYSMDFDLFLRIGRSGRMRHIQVPLAVFRVHPESKSVSDKGQFKYENQRARERALKRQWNTFDDVLVRWYLFKTVLRFLMERRILVARRDESKA